MLYIAIVRYSRSIATAIVFVVAAVGLALAERWLDYPAWLEFAPLVMAFAFGLTVGRWWAVLIPAGLLLVSLPFTLDVGDFVSVGSSFVAMTALGVGVRLAGRQTARDYRGVQWQTVLVVFAYVAVMGGFMVYAASLETDDSAVAGTVAFLVLQVLVGLALGRWRALLLVALLPILAIPVPTPEDAYEPLPLWFGMLIFAPLIAALIAAGVGARKVWNRLRSPAVA
jgi:hypothetical protein